MPSRRRTVAKGFINRCHLLGSGPLAILVTAIYSLVHHILHYLKRAHVMPMIEEPVFGELVGLVEVLLIFELDGYLL